MSRSIRIIRVITVEPQPVPSLAPVSRDLSYTPDRYIQSLSMRRVRRALGSLTSSREEEEERANTSARSLHSEMMKSMGSLGSILTLTSRAFYNDVLGEYEVGPNRTIKDK